MIRQRGFSLIEMAFVLVIITLLLGGLLVPFTTQVEQRRIAETQKGMEEIKEALVGYALSHPSTSTPSQPYLPCPDATVIPVVGGGIPNDGQEDRNAGACAVAEGNLPWVDLGLSPADAWGNRFHYRVDLDFANSVNGFSLATVGDIVICKNAACVVADRVANSIPASVLSYGKNGYGALNANRLAGDVTPNPCPPPATTCTMDEAKNIDASDALFVSRTLTAVGTPAGEFDDLVTWLSPNILFNRMVAAGKLP